MNLSDFFTWIGPDRRKKWLNLGRYPDNILDMKEMPNFQRFHFLIYFFYDFGLLKNNRKGRNRHKAKGISVP